MIEDLEYDIVRTIKFEFIKNYKKGSVFESNLEKPTMGTIVFNGLVIVQLEKDGVYRMTGGVPKTIVHELLGHAYSYMFDMEEMLIRGAKIRTDGFDNDEEYHAIAEVENPSGVIMNEIHLKNNEAFIFNAPALDHQYKLGFKYEVAEDWVSSMPKKNGSFEWSRFLTEAEMVQEKLSLKPGESLPQDKVYLIPCTVKGYQANTKGELEIAVEDQDTRGLSFLKIAGQPTVLAEKLDANKKALDKIEELNCNK